MALAPGPGYNDNPYDSNAQPYGGLHPIDVAIMEAVAQQQAQLQAGSQGGVPNQPGFVGPPAVQTPPPGFVGPPVRQGPPPGFVGPPVQQGAPWYTGMKNDAIERAVRRNKKLRPMGY